MAIEGPGTRVAAGPRPLAPIFLRVLESARGRPIGYFVRTCLNHISQRQQLPPPNRAHVGNLPPHRTGPSPSTLGGYEFPPRQQTETVEQASYMDASVACTCMALQMVTGTSTTAAYLGQAAPRASHVQAVRGCGSMLSEQPSPCCRGGNEVACFFGGILGGGRRSRPRAGDRGTAAVFRGGPRSLQAKVCPRGERCALRRAARAAPTGERPLARAWRSPVGCGRLRSRVQRAELLKLIESHSAHRPGSHFGRPAPPMAAWRRRPRWPCTAGPCHSTG